jgi:pimeloyl-ACP methyl ester carboxylesterase|tara:strand:- start:133 stop:942 length:810 start_codon:yes stop_codon:yes gene_type:complete
MTVKRAYAEGPFGQIHFQDTVEGDIPLVLCHQSPMTSRQYDRAYPVLAELGIRAIGIDTIGFGMSDPPPGPPIIGDYATSIPAVLDHLGLDSAHVGGHHTGTKVVTEAALAYPDRIRSLVLSSPAPMTQAEQKVYIDTSLEREKAYAAKEDGSHLSQMFVNRLPWIKDEPDGLDLCTSYTIQTLMGLGPFWYGHHAAFHYDAGVAMGKLTQPVLVLVNTGDMLYDMAGRTMEMFPHFSYAEIQGGGVDIVDQMPEVWSGHVANYLKSLA